MTTRPPGVKPGRQGGCMIRIGLIGAGRIGRIHAGNVAANSGATLAAVSDAIPKAAAALAKETGARAETLDGLMADNSIDAVMICSPTDTHADFIERSVKAGKAVFCEKPVDLNSKRIQKCLS